METVTEKKSHGWTIYLIVSAYLILTFLWRFFVPAHEFPDRASVFLDIGLDLLLFICLIGLRSTIFAAMDEDDGRRLFGKTLFGFALVAGLGILAMRFLGGDTQWWTGHRLYDLLPR